MALLSRLYEWVSQHVILIIGALIPIYFVYLFISTYALPVPFSDQWELSGKLAIEVHKGHLPLEYIVSRDKGHRLVFMNLLTVASAFAFDWNPRIEAFVNPLFALVNYILLLLMFKKQSPQNLRWVVIPFSAMVFSLYPFDTWVYSWNIAWIQVLCFFLAALYVLQRNPPGWRPLVGAMVLACCATFAFGNGFLVWAILLVVMWMLGYRHWYHFGFWLLVGAAAVGVYFLAGGSEGSTAPIPKLTDLPDVVYFIVIALGSPFSLHIYQINLATVVGAAGIFMLSVNLLYLWRYDWRWDHMGVWLGLAAYAVGTSSVSALARFEPGDPYRAVAARYAAATMPLWVALVALMVIVIRHIQNRESAGQIPNWHTVLKRGNLFFGLLLIPLYVQASMVVMQLSATQFNRFLAYSHSTPSNAEICVRDYPLYRNVECLQNFPFNGGASPYFVYRLAAYRINIFAREEPVFILPDTYQAGSPIIIDTPSVWLNSYVRDTLLNSMDDDLLFHIAPDGDVDFFDALPQPLTHLAADVSPDTLTQLDDFIGDAEQVWYISTSETAGHDSVIRQAFAEQTYLPTISPIDIERYRGADYIVVRFQRAPEDLQTLYTFNAMIHLQAWSAANLDFLQACDKLTLQSWWQPDAVPDFNYSATLVLVNQAGEALARTDGQLANIPMQLWEPDTLYLDERILSLPCDLPPGSYDVLLGIYNYETAEDLPVMLPNGESVGNRAYLTTIEIRK